MKKKILCLILCIASLLSFSGCSQDYGSKPFNEKATTNVPPDGAVIAQNDKYNLCWESQSSSVKLVDKQTGKSWGTAPADNGEVELDVFGLPKKKSSQVLSALILEYMNDSTNVEEQVDSNSAAESGRIVAQKIKNGIVVKYYFDSQKIMIPVEYVLREDSVSVSINPKAVEEENFKVTSIQLTPFWCSAKNDSENAYLFVPSGSGALASVKSVSQAGNRFKSQVYGDDPVMLAEDLPSTKREVRLPVYGAKNGDTGSLAIIENGAESAVIEAISGSTSISYSGVYAKFQIRGYSPNYAKFMQGLEKKLNIYSKKTVTEKFTVGFYPLTGENANYSGMARVYKEYLKSNGALTEKVNSNIINVTLIGGSNVNKSFLGIPYKTVLPATTIKQAEEILLEIKENTDAEINARLIGFGENGIDREGFAGGFTVSSNLGSKKDLKNFNEVCEKNRINLYFDFDIISLKGNSSGYSALFDTAYSALNKIAPLYDYNVATRSRIEDSKYNLLKRKELMGAAEKLFKKYDSFGVKGISLSTLSNTAYSDYSDDKEPKYYSKANMGKDVTAIYKKLSKKHLVASADANLYSALLSDVIYDAPLTSDKSQIFFEDVPFYQMVFRGFTVMSGSSVNMSESPEKAVLQTAETGISLGYTLCGKWENEFIDHTGYEFFGSEYAGVKDSVFNSYKRLEDYYSAINGAEILDHKIHENGLRETVFDNGVRIFVNYSDKSVKSPLGEVKPNDLLWGGAS